MKNIVLNTLKDCGCKYMGKVRGNAQLFVSDDIDPLYIVEAVVQDLAFRFGDDAVVVMKDDKIRYENLHKIFDRGHDVVTIVVDPDSPKMCIIAYGVYGTPTEFGGSSLIVSV